MVKMIMRRWFPTNFVLIVLAIVVAGLALGAADGALAAEPKPWQMDFQPAATPVMERIVDFHILLLVVEVAIVVFVLFLMLYIIIKFNAKSNPIPTKTTHHTGLEIVWTLLPIIVLMVIAVPSMRTLFFMDKAANPEMTLKIIGHQWYWSYQYPDNGGIEFDSNIVPEEDLKKGQIRLLSVDNQVVLPIDTEIRLLMTSEDVIHNWAIPAFGVKMDTVPGRTNEAWVKITRPGVYYGQCSELCGVNHGFMPIAVRAVSKEDFKKWTVKAKKEFARNESVPVQTPVKVAQAKDAIR